MKRALKWIVGLGIVVLLLGWLAMRGMGGAPKQAAELKATVGKGSVKDEVVESGIIDAVRNVEVKSKVGGRLERLMVDEGDVVRKGDLIAIIDPQETELRVQQDEAQLRGATSATERTSIEIQQRRKTSAEALRRARLRLQQLEEERRVQPTLTKTAISAAQAALDASQKDLDLLMQTEHPNERSLVQSNLTEANANVENSERELTRRSELLNRGFVSQRDVEEARLQRDLARARLTTAQDRANRLDREQLIERQQAEQRLKQARVELDRAKANSFQDRTKQMEYQMAVADVRTSEAALADVAALEKSRNQSQASADQIRSVLNDSRRLLRETEIRSPIDGVVTVRAMQVGELVSPLSGFSTGTTIVRIEDQTGMMVKLDVNEIDVVKLSRNMKASVEVDSLPDRKLDGYVYSIAPASKATGTQAAAATSDQVVKYEVEIRLRTQEPRLRSGMSAKVRLAVAAAENVLTLPAEYVGKDDEGRFVEIEGPKVGNKPGKPQKVRIKTGLVTNAKVEITGGVKEGQVVLRPAYKGPPRKGMMEGGPD
ncbi:MAG: Multidrug resistance protein MdtA [Fimbriimonadaceae bacterium]|nr:Multidrug resistance protein MdtA [Fimbriimonadaceae bacterium]